MTYNQLAVLVATIVACLPLLVVGRTIYFAFVSGKTFMKTKGLVTEHNQPKNDDGEPIQLRLRYEYEVNGTPHVGRRYYFGSINECDSSLLDMYPMGSIVTVYYDPETPKRSTLATGYNKRLSFWLGVSVIASFLLWIVTWILMHLNWEFDASAALSSI